MLLVHTSYLSSKVLSTSAFPYLNHILPEGLLVADYPKKNKAENSEFLPWENSTLHTGVKFWLSLPRLRILLLAQIELAESSYLADDKSWLSLTSLGWCHSASNPNISGVENLLKYRFLGSNPEILTHSVWGVPQEQTDILGDSKIWEKEMHVTTLIDRRNLYLTASSIFT